MYSSVFFSGVGSTAAWRCSVSISSLQLAALALQLGHAAERAGVRRIDAQRLLHRVDRVLEVAEVLARTSGRS